VADDEHHSELVTQLRTEVGAIAQGLATLLGPSEAMREVELRVDSYASMWASYLLGDDDKLAAQTVIDLVNVLFPDDREPPRQWWRTPLGRAVARSVGHPNAETVSYSVAGAILRCTKQMVAKHVVAGRLERGPGGGVTAESVRSLLVASGREQAAELRDQPA
jgi:hypothetical protein